MLLLLGVTFIAVATLTPAATSAPGSGFCLLNCGPRATADAVANLLLFLPLGFALGFVGIRPRRAVLAGAALSLLIELAQLSLISGRDANPADVLSNSMGALLGAWMGFHFLPLLAPTRSRVRPLLTGSAVAAVGMVAATGILLSPWLPEVEYHGQWSEYRGRFHAYSGTVLSASIGSEPLPREGVASPRLRAQMLQGAPLRVSLIVGPIRAWPSQIVRVGEGPGNILLLTANGPDLLLFYRSRSGALRLDEPVVRLGGILREVEEGATLLIETRRGEEGTCLTVRGRESCPTLMPGSGWQLIQNAWSYAPWVRATANALVIFLLCLPIGVWTRRDGFSALVLVLSAAALMVVPEAVGLRAMQPWDWVFASGGWLGGALLAALARHQAVSTEGPTTTRPGQLRAPEPVARS